MRLISFVEAVIPGAGAFEIAAHSALTKYKETVKGRARLGIQAFADALLVIPKMLAQNAGFDAQDTMVKLQDEYASSGKPVGIDISSGLLLKLHLCQRLSLCSLLLIFLVRL